MIRCLAVNSFAARGPPIFVDMDDLATWADVATRLTAMPRGAKASLAKALAMDPSYLHRKLQTEADLTIPEARRIEAFLNSEVPPGIEQGAGQRRIPVYGYAAARGEDRIAFAEGEVLEWREPPAGLAARDDFFIVMVAGGSMEPRIFSGEQLVAQRNKPPGREQDVVVELKDGTAIVKTYRRFRDGLYHLAQYNPEREITIPWDQVRAIHAVFARL